MIYTYNSKNYNVEIVKKNNKNTYIRIKDGVVYVTTSKYTTIKTIKKIIEENTKSINKMIDRYERKEEKKKHFLLFGKKYNIIYDDTIKNIEFNDNTIYVKNENKLEKYIKNYIKDVYLNHLKYWYNIFEENIPYPNLKIRKMKTRWGVCNTSTHNITLNQELYRYDIKCLDYVIVHELSHLIEANHSKKFWNIVEKYYPNYKAIRKQLRD